MVVFDCNVYLDVANLIGTPLTWDALTEAVVTHSQVPLGSRRVPGLDSARALAVCTSGRFVANEPLEVWTGSHINFIVRDKACQSTTPDPKTGYRGLGMTEDEADSLVEDLIGGILKSSRGGNAGDPFPDSNPPLDHEDGKVYGICRWLASDDPLAEVYCVTNDAGFLQAAKQGRLGRHTRVMPPATFVQLIRRARTQAAHQTMLHKSV